MMFRVDVTTLGTTTIIVLKSKQPFVQMSYQYDGDFSTLTDEEAIAKVLDSFYNDNYKNKIQESKITELEATQLKQQQALDALVEDVSALKGGTTA